MKNNDNKKRRTPIFGINGPLVNLFGIVLGITAAYFITIQSLKVDIALKAESAVVDAMDRKLAGLEALLQQGIVTNEQFNRFSTDTETRLIRIENYLIENAGEKRGR